MAFTFKNKVPSVRFEGSNEEKRRNRNKKDVVVSKRLVVLIGMVITLSILLVGRLAYIQLTQGDMYAVKLDKYGTVKYTSEAPRGEIVDRNGVKLVKNTNIINAMYYAPKSISLEEITLTANFLVANVEMDISGITERQKKDYFMMACEKIAEGLVSTEERKALQAEDNATKMIENLMLQRISEELMNEHMDETLLKKTRLIYLMQQCTSGTVVLIEGLNADYASIIGQNKSLLKGVSVTTDWSREYVNGANSSFARVLGKVTTKKQGLPAEQKAELSALGYQNDSRVGTSGLEQQYESLLRGTNTTYSVNYDTDGNPIISNSVKGVAGSTLRLSIDWELQQYADQVLEEELKACRTLPGNKEFDRIFLILMDPNNGDIIVMSGKQIDDDGVVSDFAAGNYIDQQLIGSTTKGGTIYTGFKLDIIQPNTYFMDEPIKIKDTKEKSSYRNLGYINEVDSLALSSNVYMFNIAFKLGEGTYAYEQPLVLKSSAFETYRQCIGELGLGVKTGLDVSDESIGYRGSDHESGLLLNLVIGQYDMYTNIQLAQYTATLANRGKRIQPRLLLDASNIDSSGDSVTTFEKEVKILDDVSDQSVAFEQIHQGFRACVTRGLCASPWASKSYTVSAKTGTAEVIDSLGDYPNTLTVGWASEENPQVVFSSFCARQTISSRGTQSSSGVVAGLVMDKYHEKYGIK